MFDPRPRSRTSAKHSTVIAREIESFPVFFLLFGVCFVETDESRVHPLSNRRAKEKIMDGHHKTYGLPQNYNPIEFPPVVMRQKSNHGDGSETQRKRRSKNRLSNRRSTGFISREDVEAAKNPELTCRND